MRAPVSDIAAPPFPAGLTWLNTAPLRMDKQLGRPVLIEFWDFCRANSMRTMPYVKAWHERYAAGGLRVIGVHAPGFAPSRPADAVRDAVARLGIEHAVAVDSDFEVWQLYGNEGWPARYLFDGEGMLFHYHYGEGAYAETEQAIGELLGVELEPLEALRPEDRPGALLAAPSADREGAWSGPYEAGGVWAVLDGNGEVTANGASVAVKHPGCFALIEHEHHSTGVLELDVGSGVTCHAVCFTPGAVG